MKNLVFAFILVLLITNISFSQYDDPNLDRIPAEFWDAISPQSVNAVITDASGYDNFNIGTDFAEPHLSMNPTNPLNCFVAYNTNGAHYVTDGYNWSATSSPSFGVTVYGDPVTAFDSLGNLFYENMIGGITGTRFIKSVNGGVTFGAGVVGNNGVDKNWAAADQTNGPYKNYIYTVMTPNGSLSNVRRSINNGVSFIDADTLANSYPGMMVCIGPNGSTSGGSVYIVTNTGASAFAVTYNFYRSTTGGTNFVLRSSQNYAGYVGTNVAGRHSVQNMRTRPYPMIAADNSYGTFRGRLYLVYAANSPAGDGNKPNIYCRYSTDQGLTFSSPILVNDNASPDLSDQFFPAIWCDKTTGRLYCKWFDTRLDATNNTMHVYASYSDNGGVTWVANQRITTAAATINCTTCGGGGTPRYQGDYDAVSSNPVTSMMAWTDMRAGTFGSYTAYYPDFAMLVNPAASTVHQTNSFKNIDVSIPSVKSYANTVTFTTEVSPSPATGSIVADFPDGSTLSSVPGTATMRVRTIGTVTPLGNYTVTVTGAGPNGTPVHKRTVTMTVNTTLGPTPCEDFTNTAFPPADFFEEFSGTNYWSRQTPSAYGIGAGSARFNFYSAGPTLPINQSLISNNFAATAAGTYLTFDEAYAPFTSFGPDTLLVESSTNFGASFTILATLLGKSDGSGELNTAPATSSSFTPVASQWRPKIYSLPTGTNKIRLKAKSGYGNNLYIDNVCIQSLPAQTTSTVGVISEGMFKPSDPYWALLDTIRVYLHRSDLPNIIVDSAKTTMSSNAVSNTLTFTKALTGNYYRVVKHRNCIITWTAVTQAFTRGVAYSNYNLVQPDGQAYGNNQAIVSLSPFYRGMFSGDINDDDIIDGSDLSGVDNGAFSGLSGYVVEDLNGDSFVDASDVSIVDNNVGVTAIEPPGAAPSVNPAETDKKPEFKTEADRQKYESTIVLSEIKKAEDIKIQELKKKEKEIINRQYNIYNRKKTNKPLIENSNNSFSNSGRAGQ